MKPDIFRTLTSSQVGGAIDLDSSPEKPPRPSIVEESGRRRFPTQVQSIFLVVTRQEMLMMMRISFHLVRTWMSWRISIEETAPSVWVCKCVFAYARMWFVRMWVI